MLETAYAFDAREFAAPVAASEIVALAQAVEGVEGVALQALYRPPFFSNTPAPVEPLLLAAPARMVNGIFQKAEILTLAPVNLTLREAAP